jgi:hypothetical protein
MIGLDSHLLLECARACAGALLAALAVACASDAPPAPPRPLEVLRTTDEDGSVSYTLKRNRVGGEIPADPDAATSPDGAPPTAPSPELDGGEASDPGASIRDQLETDREVLRSMISTDAPAGFERSQSPKLREIAERLPRLQAEVEALENEPEP